MEANKIEKLYVSDTMILLDIDFSPFIVWK